MLRSMIEPQEINLQVAIKRFHENELLGRYRYIQDGKVILHRNLDFKRPYWVEVLP